MGGTVQHGLGAFHLDAGLIADRLERCHAVGDCRLEGIEGTALHGFDKPLEPQFGVGETHVEFGHVVAATLRTVLSAIEDGGEDVFQPLGIEQSFLDMADHHAVELVHGDGAALAAGHALPRLDGAGIIAVTAALAGAQRHGTSAVAAIADAGQEDRPGDDARRCHLRVADPEMFLHGVEGRLLDDRRDRDGDDFLLGLQFLGLGALVELMLADIGAPGEDAVKLADPPAAAVAREDAVLVQVVDDGLDAHRAGAAFAFKRKAVDQPHGVGVQRVDVQLLLDLGTALLGIDDAVADGRQRPVPEALPGVLLQGAQDVLGVLL